MKIAVCSMFRDSVKWKSIRVDQVKTYFHNMLNQTIGFDNLEFHLLEGDSQDDTYSQLLSMRDNYPNINVYKSEINESYDSVTITDKRLKCMSKIGNVLLSYARGPDSEYDYLLWVESDLVIKEDTIERLVDTIKGCEHTPSIVAPFVTLGPYFYDIWAFRNLKGKNWPNVISPNQGILEVSSLGSCAIMDKEITADFGEGSFVSLCGQARKDGARLFVNTDIVIDHPNRLLVERRWV